MNFKDNHIQFNKIFSVSSNGNTKGIKTYEYLHNFGDSQSPARVNRATGHMQLNWSRLKNIKPEHRLFIYLHENAHVELNSSNEYAVDAKAFEDYIKLGYALTESVFALTRVLHSDSEQSRKRCYNQYLRALNVNKFNKKPSNYNDYESLDGFTDFNGLATSPNIVILDVQDSFDGDSIEVSYYDYPDIAAELAKVPKYSRKDQRKMKKSIRMYKKMGRARKKYAKADKVKATANDIQAGADTRDGYMKQGIYVPTRAESIGKGIGGGIDKVAGVVKSVFGGGGETEAAEETEQPQPQQQYKMAGDRQAKPQPTATQKKNNMLIYGGVGFVVVAVILFMVIKK